MNDRINEKICEIEQYSEELKEIIPEEYADYKGSKTIKAACERYFDIIIESVTDLILFIIKDKKIYPPEDDLSAFEIFSEKFLSDKNLFKRLQDAKRMRNFIVHRYKFVDDLLVYNSIKEELFEDIEKFLKEVKKVR